MVLVRGVPCAEGTCSIGNCCKVYVSVLTVVDEEVDRFLCREDVKWRFGSLERFGW